MDLFISTRVVDVSPAFWKTKPFFFISSSLFPPKNPLNSFLKINDQMEGF